MGKGLLLFREWLIYRFENMDIDYLALSHQLSLACESVLQFENREF